MAHVGSGWAKLLLFGEHAAVYGYSAVGLSLRTTLRVRLQPEVVECWKIVGAGKKDRAKILEVLTLLADHSAQGSERNQGGGTLSLESEIPRGLGFGSSASLCVALAKAIADWRGGADTQRIWEWAHLGEKLFHGTPSGIDTGLALLGGLYNFQPHPPDLPDAERLTGMPLHLVVGAVPRARTAGALIGVLREKIAAGDGRVLDNLQRLGTLAGGAAEILRPRRIHREEDRAARDLGAFAWEAQEALSRLNLSTPELDWLLEEGRLRGAAGGKLSGAGGGGAFYLIYPDSETAREAASALKQLSRVRRLATADSIYQLSWLPDSKTT